LSPVGNNSVLEDADGRGSALPAALIASVWQAEAVSAVDRPTALLRPLLDEAAS